MAVYNTHRKWYIRKALWWDYSGRLVLAMNLAILSQGVILQCTTMSPCMTDDLDVSYSSSTRFAFHTFNAKAEALATTQFNY